MFTGSTAPHYRSTFAFNPLAILTVLGWRISCTETAQKLVFGAKYHNSIYRGIAKWKSFDLLLLLLLLLSYCSPSLTE